MIHIVLFLVFLLFHLINSYGFNFQNCVQMLDTKHASGKKFYSENHIALIDRRSILIKKSEIINTASFQIDTISKPAIFNQLEFNFREIPNQHIELKTQLNEPLHHRGWPSKSQAYRR